MDDFSRWGRLPCQQALFTSPCQGCPPNSPAKAATRLSLQGAEGSRGVDLSQLQEYFQLEQVVAGLSGLLEQLMGVSLEEQPLEKGALWAAAGCA